MIEVVRGVRRADARPGVEKHPEYEMYREWIPVDYDPARFDLDEINEAFAQLGAAALQR